jgi:hypothetical protein
MVEAEQKDRVRLGPGPRRAYDARREFLRCLASEAPAVLQSLHDEVFPLYRQAREARGKQRRGARRGVPHHALWLDVEAASETRLPGLFPLKQALRDWARRWHLTDPWALDTARATLDLWASSPSSLRNRVWQLPSLRFARPGSVEDRRPALVETAEYRPERESPEAFAAGVRARVEAALRSFTEAQKARLAMAGWAAATWKDPHHFTWLVQYQARGWSLGRIARQSGYGRKTVEAAVKVLAAVVGVTLRPASKGGRPATRHQVRPGA